MAKMPFVVLKNTLTNKIKEPVTRCHIATRTHPPINIWGGQG
tara:strand:- start:590 stop:715 length:126 start_codon:yes stop_codon:yes gene_type:complete